MPQLQVLDLGDEQPSALETTLKSFNEQRQQAKETDALKEIYSRYQAEGRNIDDAIFEMQTDPRIGPTRRVEAAKVLTDAKKANTQALKNEKTLKAEAEKLRIAKELDTAEVDYLKSIEGQNLSPTEIYAGARQRGIPATRANNIATMARLEGKEGRLTENEIYRNYDYEIKEKDREIKNTLKRSEKEALQTERKKLVEMRNADLRDYRGGKKDLTLRIHAPEPDPEVQAITENVKSAVEELTAAFPPQQNKGKTKIDPDTGIEYTSDGKEWLPDLQTAS